MSTARFAARAALAAVVVAARAGVAEAADAGLSAGLGVVAVVLLVVAGALAVAVFNLSTGRSGARGFQVVVPSKTAADQPFNNDAGTHIYHKHVQVGRLLGLGAIGKVYRGRYRGLDVAIKVLACRTTEARVHDDVESLIRVRHPSLVLFMGITSPKDGQVCLVSEYMSRGNLYETLHNPKIVLNWKQRLGMARSVAQAMSFLHHGGHSIVHESLSSLNVLVTDDLEVKVSDYGLATLRRHLRNSQHQAKPYWSAPEVIKSNKHSRASDVYAFGVLLHEIVTRQVPFSHVRFANQALLVKAICAGQRPPVPVGCPPRLASLLTACWHASPGRRPKFSDIVDALFDPSLADADLDRMITVSVDANGDGAGAAGPDTDGFFLRAIADAGVKDAKRWMLNPADLTVESLLGVGSLGEVFLGKFHGKRVAVKKVHRDSISPAQLRSFANEVRVLCSLRHPNTLLILGVCEQEGYLCIVTEYCERGSLDAVLRDTSEHIDYTRVVSMLTDIAQGMAYLHLSKPPILHRDLKSLNILVGDDWTCKVADYNISQLGSGVGGAGQRNAGTPFWLAPEAMEDGTFTSKSDTYSYGIVAWEVFTRDTPFKSMNPHQAALAVMTQDARPEIPDYVPPRVQSLIRRCWARNPDERPSFSEVLRDLEVIRREGLPRTHLTLENAVLYRKRHLVYAFPSKDAVTVCKKWGTGTSQPGDYVVVGPDDDVYTCAADIFHRTYAPVNDEARPNAYRKVTTVLALEMKGAFLIETLEGSEHGKKGDFLAQNPVDGEQWPISSDVFRGMYEAVPADALPAESQRIEGLRAELERKAAEGPGPDQDAAAAAAGGADANGDGDADGDARPGSASGSRQDGDDASALLEAEAAAGLSSS